MPNVAEGPISELSRTIERDRVPQPRPVALAFFSPESFPRIFGDAKP